MTGTATKRRERREGTRLVLIIATGADELRPGDSTLLIKKNNKNSLKKNRIAYFEIIFICDHLKKLFPLQNETK